MQDDYLVSYCNTDIKSSFKVIPAPYWTANVYSFGKYLREYGYYPSWLPLCVYTDHGVNIQHKPFENELDSDAPTQLYHSLKSKLEWKKYSSKPCFVMYSPFVFYRIKNNVVPVVNAKGTIAFPAHSTPNIDDISDIHEYIKHLNQLPEEYHPISVCLHMHDINKGRHHVFIKHNIPVYTAGNCFDERFAERFYDIIKKFKYATSNIAGSYLYYCIEMGIPFFIYGNKQVYINYSDTNVSKGLYDPLEESHEYRQVHDMFSELSTIITPLQKEYVDISLGLRDGLSRGQMAWVLYSSLFKWVFYGTFIKYAFIFFRRLLSGRIITRKG
jgi:hypothetical protein